MAVICGVCRRYWSACAAIGQCDGHGNQRTVPKPPMPREVAELVDVAEECDQREWTTEDGQRLHAAIAAVRALYRSEP